MRPEFLLVLATVMLGLSGISKAQDNSQLLPSKSAGIEQRFQQCLSACTVQQQLQLMQDMTDDMGRTLRQINQTCKIMKYEKCISFQRNAVLRWHKMHRDANSLMHAMEAQYSLSALGQPIKNSAKDLNLLAPAAGPNPYTNPDEEKLERQKGDWWQGWSPPEEDNPYHQW